ncbi:hypothetical protein [Geomesophilobacter sediminis]|uniref:Secreted protein n=1 Tax=Geomesophilobacter sediminis TaxID=2798584 RepID=A0A8J7LUY4_9BACT|nr:hypothetical protein [Geomesophilobacter sediminis]MBJ6724300.1 hypothetical protein [Geomesophilobacter sediminis]
MNYRALLGAALLCIGVTVVPASAAPALPEPGADADVSLNQTIAAALNDLYAVIQQNLPAREAAAVAAFVKSNGPSTAPTVTLGAEKGDAAGTVPLQTLARLAAGDVLGPAAPPAPQGGSVLVGSGAVSSGDAIAAAPAAAATQVTNTTTLSVTTPPTTVPLPPALLLFGSGVATLFSLRRPLRLVTK